MRDPLAAKFEKTLDPWQRSAKKFDFDPEFVRWIQKYLEKLECISEVVMAKSWINGANFNEKRHDDCTLQWEAFQESIANRPPLKAVVAHHSESGGVGDSASQSVEPELPDEFKRLEGESLTAYNKRVGEIARQKMAQMTENMSFRSKK